MNYLLDSNIFIRSKNELPMDIYISFWKKIIELANEGHIYSSEKVRDEIVKGKDELVEWVKANLANDFFLPVDAEVIAKYTEAQDWAASNPMFIDVAKQTFADVADAFLVATAAAKNMILVTYEKSDPNCKKRVLIPDACNAVGAHCCDLNTAFRELHVII